MVNVANQNSNNFSQDHLSNTNQFFKSPKNILVIYTVLSILNQMRRHLGLEAMLDYIKEYMQTIEKHNPKIQWAVCQAIKFINLNKMYEDAKQDKTE